MTEIIELTRNLISDNLITTGRDIWIYESSVTSKIITLTESNVVAASIIVYKNGVVWANNNYSFSSDTGKLTITGTLTVGNTLEITYSYYAKYSDTELKAHIKAAITHLAVEKYKTFTVKTDDVIFPTPTLAESNLISLIANILIKGDIISYKTPEFTITFARGDSIEKKIKKACRQFRKCYGVLDYIDLGDKIVPEE